MFVTAARDPSTAAVLRIREVLSSLRMTTLGNYFCATNSRARFSSGLVEFDPSQIFNSST